jgi:hypothetical protein
VGEEDLGAGDGRGVSAGVLGDCHGLNISFSLLTLHRPGT